MPVVMKCDDCGVSYEVNLKQNKKLSCPECGSKKNTLISGREYFIKNMEAI